MKIKEFKTTDIKTISNEDLRIILSNSFNKKIIKDIQKEFLRRDNPII